jgi:hypothetical protein
VDDALSFLWVRLEKGFYGVRGEGVIGVDGRLRCFAWRAVGEEDAIFARELFKGDWYEASDTAYDEDLVVLVGFTFHRKLPPGSMIMHRRGGVREGLEPLISVEGTSAMRVRNAAVGQTNVLIDF